MEENIKDWKEIIKVSVEEFCGEEYDIEKMSFSLLIPAKKFYDEDYNLLFEGLELQIEAFDEDDNSLCFLYNEIFCGKIKSTNDYTIIENTPSYSDAGLSESGVTNMGGGDLENTIHLLKKFKTLDYNKLSESDKKDFCLITN